MNPLMDNDGDEMKPGKGLSQRFASLKAALAKRSGVKSSGALAASLGKKKKKQQGDQLQQMAGNQ